MINVNKHSQMTINHQLTTGAKIGYDASQLRIFERSNKKRPRVAVTSVQEAHFTGAVRRRWDEWVFNPIMNLSSSLLC